MGSMSFWLTYGFHSQEAAAKGFLEIVEPTCAPFMQGHPRPRVSQNGTFTLRLETAQNALHTMVFSPKHLKNKSLELGLLLPPQIGAKNFAGLQTCCF